MSILYRSASGGIIARKRFTIDSYPDVVAGRTFVFLDFPDHREMRLVIGINPIQKQPHDVIGNNSRAAGVGYQLHKKFALFVGVGNVPFAERFAYQSQVFSASNSLLYLLTQPFHSL